MRNKISITNKEFQSKLNAMLFFDTVTKDNLSYAIGRVKSLNKTVIESSSERLNDLRMPYCLLDDKGAYISNERGEPKFDPKTASKRVDDERKYNNETIEIDTWIVPVDRLPQRLYDAPIEILMELNGLLFEIDIEALYSVESEKKTEK